jgi:hypothetical protein
VGGLNKRCKINIVMGHDLQTVDNIGDMCIKDRSLT